jgi:polysaccharide export outer membrane protein
MLKNIISLLVLLGVLVGPLAAQEKPPAPVAPLPPSTASPTYRVGAADVLDIKVFDEPALTNKYGVDSDGTITFPFLSRIKVLGLTVREVEEIITSGLKPNYVKNAQVSVEVASFRSRSVYVLGEVKGPGKYIIEGPPVTLLEVIAKAGSFTTTAGPTIIVQRYKDGIAASVATAPADPKSDQTAELLRVDIEDLKQGRFNANIVLQDNDTIIIPAAERFYVTGFVRTPGAYVLRPGLTVQQAIAEAGGLTERGPVGPRAGQRHHPHLAAPNLTRGIRRIHASRYRARTRVRQLLARRVALSRTALLPRVARRPGSLQANGYRRCLGPDPAGADDGRVCGVPEAGGRAAFVGAGTGAGLRRGAAVAVLRHRRARGIQQPDRQRRSGLEGVFPAIDHPAGVGDHRARGLRGDAGPAGDIDGDLRRGAASDAAGSSCLHPDSRRRR